MRRTIPIVAVAALAGCGASEPTPKAPSNTSSTQRSDDPSRALTEGECRSLGAWIAGACNDRGNTRSSQIDGWCSDMVRGTDSAGTWATDDCVKHVKYMDAACFRSTTQVNILMDCDRNVDRSN